MEEPWIKATILIPNQYIDQIDALTRERRGKNVSTKFIDQNNVLIENRYPLSEVITDFLDTLNILSSGYASFDYQEDGYEEVNVVVLSFKINGEALGK